MLLLTSTCKSASAQYKHPLYWLVNWRLNKILRAKHAGLSNALFIVHVD